MGVFSAWKASSGRGFVLFQREGSGTVPGAQTRDWGAEVLLLRTGCSRLLPHRFPG